MKTKAELLAPAPTEHTAADAPTRKDGECTDLAPPTSAAGVPDVSELIANLQGDAKFYIPLPEISARVLQAAEALDAMQDQLTNFRHANKWQAGRIKEVEAKSDELGKQNYRLINELAAAVDRAQALKADAERWRWLRLHSYKDGNAFPTISYGKGFQQSKPELLDAAIDAAMKEGK